jgi:hypothetical protein
MRPDNLLTELAYGPSLPIQYVRSLVAMERKAEVLVTIVSDAPDPGCEKTSCFT